MKSFLIALLVVCVGATPALMLNACTATQVSDGLAIVQAEAKTIDTAVDTLAPSLIMTLPAATQTKANEAVTALDAAVVALDAATVSGTETQDAVTFLSAAEQVVGVLPLPADTVTEVDVGLSLAQAFVAGLTVTVPASSTLAPLPNVVPGPVPIPLT